MPTVFAYIGSPHGSRSNTYALAKMMLDRLAEKDDAVRCEIFTPAETAVRYCRGCWTCMTKGFCPQDEHDDMAMLRERMENASFIVLGSPVYAINVSGQMKTFFDRLPAWLHTMRLAGKAGVTVATTAGSGLPEVQNYLGMMMASLGVKTVGTLGSYGSLPGHLYDPDGARNDARALADAIYSYVTGERAVTTDEYLEEVFGIMKQKIEAAGEGVLAGDLDYWTQAGYLECSCFADVLEKRKRLPG
ncbi:flavodoxin family protein [Methanoculleus sediminis]|uniref:flavodoxin family protein n=1 Tax=Methanoculleus sediminis TaxID=1550566 RepID=UPI000699FCDB|nr:flavodoxin family protein [Methanoculleus sediminis]